MQSLTQSEIHPLSAIALLENLTDANDDHFPHLSKLSPHRAFEI